MDLIDASRLGNLVRVRELLVTGVDPNIVDGYGLTSLYWASRKGYLEVVRELLAVGADPNIVDDYGYRPSYWATVNKHFQVSELLETYFPTLCDLSLRNVRKFKIDFSSI